MITDLELTAIVRKSEQIQQTFARDIQQLQDKFRKDLDDRTAQLVEELLDLHDEMDVLDVGWSTNVAGQPTINFTVRYPSAGSAEVAGG